jgi:predicted acylesterase/phospholipase RssA
MVLGGGGFRFGYYLGIFAALQKLGKKPDVLLACCGGAMAAGIIQAFTDDEQRKDWLSSPVTYQFWRDLKSSRDASISRTLIGVIRRRLFATEHDVIPDLFNDYLFDIPTTYPLPPADQPRAKDVDVAIIAGKLLFQESDVKQPRKDRKLFAQTVFCENRTASLLEGMTAPSSFDSWGNSAVAPAILTDSVPIEEAVRASVADMFLFRCHTYRESTYTGGIIDLFPIEIAKRIANEVVMEKKGPYDAHISIPALRSVFGTHGNRRLSHVLKQKANWWVDTSDMEQVLHVNQIERKIAWLRNRIELVVPDSYEGYVKMIDSQWNYGYQRAMNGATTI